MSKLSKVVLIFCLFFFNNINAIKVKNEKNSLNSKFFFNAFKNNNKKEKENKKNNLPDDYLNIIVSHKLDESADRIEPDHTFNETLEDIINTFVADTTEEDIPQQIDTQQTPTEEDKPFLETITQDENTGNNQQQQKQQQKKIKR